MGRHEWNLRRALSALAAGAALLLGLVSVSVQSYAAMDDQTDAGGVGDLVVSAQPHPTEFFDMSAGESRFWSIAAELRGADRGSLALRVFGAGALIEHPEHPLTIAVEGCDGILVDVGEHQHPTCAGADFTTIIAEQPLRDISSDPQVNGDVWTLPDIVRHEARSFVVTLSVPASGSHDKTLMGLRGDVGVGLYAAGVDDSGAHDPPVADEPDDLAATGGMLPLSLLLIGAGTIGLGLVLGRVHVSKGAARLAREPGRSS